MSDDLPLPIRQAQKKLLTELKEAKEAKQEAYIRFPATLIVNGEPIRSVDPLTLEFRDGHLGRQPASYSDVTRRDQHSQRGSPSRQPAPYSDVTRREQLSHRGTPRRRNQMDDLGWTTQGRGRDHGGRRNEHAGRGGDRDFR